MHNIVQSLPLSHSKHFLSPQSFLFLPFSLTPENHAVCFLSQKIHLILMNSCLSFFFWGGGHMFFILYLRNNGLISSLKDNLVFLAVIFLSVFHFGLVILHVV